MMKWWRLALSIAVLFVLVIVLSMAALSYLIDPNQLKPVIAEQVKQNSNYQLQIDGQLSWSFYPTFGVKADRILLSTSDQATPFLELNEVRIATDFWQFLHGTSQLQGAMHVNIAKFMGLQATNTNVRVHWQNNILTLASMTADLYGGTLAGVIHGQSFSQYPLWDWNVELNHVQLKSLTEHLTQFNYPISLIGDGRIKFFGRAEGKSQNDLMSSLVGKLDFYMTNGLIQGLDLNYFVQTANAMINQQMAAQENHHQTEFNNLVGSLELKNSLATIRDFSLSATNLLARASGDLNLNTQTVDLRLQILPHQGVKSLSQVPVLISGNLTQPQVQLDTSQIQKVTALPGVEAKKKAAKVTHLSKK